MKLLLLKLLMFASKQAFYVFVIQLLAIQFLMAEVSHSQKLREIPIQIKLDNVTLKEAFKIIESETDFTFSYDSRITKLNQRFTLREHPDNLHELLEKIAIQARLKFRRVNQKILVSKDQRIRKPGQKAKVVEEVTVSGKITDAATGEPLPGATIRVKGTNIGTISNPDGNYTIAFPEEHQTLVFSFVGYLSQEIEVAGRDIIDIRLSGDVTSLSEIVVVGYSSQKVADLTGAISVVDVDQVRGLPVNGVEQAIQGRIPGVQITNDGAPGGGVSIRVRGYGTIGNNDPLYIVDGVPSKSGINQLNLNDVESIQVLKDAAATAIYGARAGNGVIVVTTKKGRQGVSKITFDAYVGTQEASNLPELLDAQQYGDVLWEAQRNAGITPTNLVYGNGASPVIPEFIDADQNIRAGNTDWFDELFEPGTIQFYNLGIRNGSSDRQSFVSASYLNQEGIIRYTGFERFNLRVNNEFKLNENITIGENLSVSFSEQVSIGNNRAIGGTVMEAYLQPAIVPVRDINGDFAGPVNGLGDSGNPVMNAFNNRDNDRKTTKIFGNMYVEIDLIKDLSLRTNFGIDYNTFNLKNFTPAFQTGILINPLSRLTQTNTTDINWVWNNVLKYERDFNDHNLTALIGTEAIRNTFEEFQAFRNDFIIDDVDFRYLNSGQGQQTNGGFGTRWSLFSLFGRVDYTFRDRYLISASVRRDGSSRFSSNNQYGTFPAFSLGYRISEEAFFQDVPVLNDLKLRFSWGQSGNQEIGDFASFTTFATRTNNTNYDINGTNNSVVPGFSLDQIGNPDVKWETTTQTNIGFDAGLFDNSLRLTFDYFIKNTDDILVQKPTLGVEGQARAPFINAGEMENKGVEIALNYFSKQYGDFSFEIAGNITATNNEVISLSDEVEFLTGTVSNNSTRGLTISRTTRGLPIAQLYGHIADGVFRNQQEVDAHADQAGAAPGRIRYRDLNNDNVINDEDRQVIGNPHPDFIYGLNLMTKFKQFDLSLFFQGVSGVDLYNFARYHTDFFFDPFNKHARILNAWSPENAESNIPQVSTVNANDELRPSTYFVEDGSYLRLKNLQIGYNVPMETSFLESLRVYFQAQNLFTLTDYDGIDPEVSLENFSSPNRNLDLGVDRGIYPNSRTFLVGVNVQF
ncbi:TonB-dependent receptor [Fulvivirgaceae bacterium BMA12]|uniref:TonB-dependent receptor n=1 Tax=Agaribacillus aureus TaxID=3051825 RepID=A0ABT8L418_9BACT|nr:TonB-dependent receptor [Fulvivirgaceae bacterium BMA12]